jgi:hypothetical protein
MDDNELMYDVILQMARNARRVATAAAAVTQRDGSDDLIGEVVAALAEETQGIAAGVQPNHVVLQRAVIAAGNAIAQIARHALSGEPSEPVVALAEAFDQFDSYLQGAGRSRILANPASTNVQ